MGSATVRSTLYLDADLHQALRIKAAESHRSMSEIANDALRAMLDEDEEDLAAFAEREHETAVSYEELLARIKPDLRPLPTGRYTTAELLERWRHLPPVDRVRFREDIESVFNSSL